MAVAKETSASAEDYISEDVAVLIQRDKTYRPFRLKRGRKLHFEKVKFYPDGALGRKFGSCFKVEKQQLVSVDDEGQNKEYTSSAAGEFRADNRRIFDDGKAQELTEGDIQAMKGHGISGQGIVTSMIEHSSSFKDKTKFSQEKYIKKKEKKYAPVFRIVKTTTILLCELYFSQTPTKTYYLRTDALSQLLTMSNTHACSNMVVMETCQGLVAGAMLERMGGYGKLVQIFYGDFPVRTILDNFGHLSASDRSILMTYPFRRVGALLDEEEAREITALSAGLLTDAQQPPQCGRMKRGRPAVADGGELEQPSKRGRPAVADGGELERPSKRGRPAVADGGELERPSKRGRPAVADGGELERPSKRGRPAVTDGGELEQPSKKVKYDPDCADTGKEGTVEGSRGKEGGTTSERTLGDGEGIERACSRDGQGRERTSSGAGVGEIQGTSCESKENHAGIEEKERTSPSEGVQVGTGDGAMMLDSGAAVDGRASSGAGVREIQRTSCESKEKICAGIEVKERTPSEGVQVGTGEAVDCDGAMLDSGTTAETGRAVPGPFPEGEGGRRGEEEGEQREEEQGGEEGGKKDVRETGTECTDTDSIQEDKKRERRKEREEAYKMAQDLLRPRNMDGLVVASRHHPLPVVMALLKFVSPSRPFAVYHHLLDPLVQCYKSLKDSNAVFNLQISETWMRHYQVLPERTHPEMQMGGQSGFILTGITVQKYS